MLASVKSSPNTRCYLDIASDRPEGRLVFELFDNVTPVTASNFASLCSGQESQSYEGTTFHRVIPNFMCQGGKLTEDVPCFDDENFSVMHTVPGLLSMANRGPNTNGSQFFVTTKPAPHLDGKHTAFGRLVKGMPILKRMEKVERDSEDCPVTPWTVVACGVLRDQEADGDPKHSFSP